MPSTLPIRSIAALCAALAATAATAAPGPLAGTDASWKVSTIAPAAADWNSALAFDDTAWAGATELYDLADYLGPDFTAKAIWSAGGQYASTEVQVWVRKVLHLDGDVLSATLVNGFDDDGDIWVNGVQVVSDHNGWANNTGPVDLKPYLVKGDNLIAYTTSDNWPTWGYNHASWVQIQGEVAAVPEPGRVALMALGLAGLAGVSRRRARDAG